MLSKECPKFIIAIDRTTLTWYMDCVLHQQNAEMFYNCDIQRSCDKLSAKHYFNKDKNHSEVDTHIHSISTDLEMTWLDINHHAVGKEKTTSTHTTTVNKSLPLSSI